MSMNKVIILGRLGKDPELRYTPSGAAVCNFSVATSEAWTDKNGQKQEKTEWHRIVVWGKMGELCNQYLFKGRQVFLEGKLQTRSWDDQNGQKRYSTEINATNVQFLGDRPQQGQSNQRPTDEQQMNQNQNQNNNNPQNQENLLDQDYKISTDANFTADDIPF